MTYISNVWTFFNSSLSGLLTLYFQVSYESEFVYFEICIILILYGILTLKLCYIYLPKCQMSSGPWGPMFCPCNYWIVKPILHLFTEHGRTNDVSESSGGPGLVQAEHSDVTTRQKFKWRQENSYNSHPSPSDSVVTNQDRIFTCLWRQKQIEYFLPLGIHCTLCVAS